MTLGGFRQTPACCSTCLPWSPAPRMLSQTRGQTTQQSPLLHWQQRAAGGAVVPVGRRPMWPLLGLHECGRRVGLSGCQEQEWRPALPCPVCGERPEVQEEELSSLTASLDTGNKVTTEGSTRGQSCRATCGFKFWPTDQTSFLGTGSRPRLPCSLSLPTTPLFHRVEVVGGERRINLEMELVCTTRSLHTVTLLPVHMRNMCVFR